MGAIKLLHKRYNRMRIVSHSTTFPQGQAKPSPSFGMSAFKLINNKFLRMDGKPQKKPLTEHALTIFSHDPVRDLPLQECLLERHFLGGREEPL